MRRYKAKNLSVHFFGTDVPLHELRSWSEQVYGVALALLLNLFFFCFNHPPLLQLKTNMIQVSIPAMIDSKPRFRRLTFRPSDLLPG